MHPRVGLMCILFLIPSALAQTPEQVHVGLGATPEDEDFGPPEAPWLRIHWMTRTAYGPTATPIVQYSIDGAPAQTATAVNHGSVQATTGTAAAADYRTVERFGYSALVQAPRGANVTYQVGTSGSLSPEHTVTNLAADPRAPIRLVALGNTYYEGCDTAAGTCPDEPASVPSLAVRHLVEQLAPAAVLHTGGVSTSGNDLGAFDAVFSMMEPLWAQVPVAVSPGPMDDAANFATFNAYWRQPGTDFGALDVANTGGVAGAPAQIVGERVDHTDDASRNYFGFSAGEAYIVVLNTARLCSVGVDVPGNVATNPAIEGAINAHGPCAEHQVFDAEQLAWLHDTLEDAREDLKTKWIIAMLGTGPYHYADDAQTDRVITQHVVPLLESFNVDLVLSSNEPAYQRSFPLWAGSPTTAETSHYTQGQGPIYVVTGGGGRPLLPERLTPGGVPWMAADAYEHHVTVVDVTNETITVQAISTQNATVLDSFVIRHATAALPPVAAAKESPMPPPLLLLGAAVAVLARRRWA